MYLSFAKSICFYENIARFYIKEKVINFINFTLNCHKNSKNLWRTYHNKILKKKLPKVSKKNYWKTVVFKILIDEGYTIRRGWERIRGPKEALWSCWQVNQQLCFVPFKGNCFCPSFESRSVILNRENIYFYPYYI